MPKTRRRTKNKASANIKRRTKRRSPRRSPRRSSPVMRLNPNAKYKRRRKQKGGDIFAFMKSEEKTVTTDNILQKLNNISDELKKLKEPISKLNEDDRAKVDQKIKELIDLHIEMKPAEAAKGANESPGADVSAVGAEGSIGASPGAQGSVGASPVGAEGSIGASPGAEGSVGASPELVDENDGEGHRNDGEGHRNEEREEEREKEEEEREKEVDKGATGGTKSGNKKLRRKN